MRYILFVLIALNGVSVFAQQRLVGLKAGKLWSNVDAEGAFSEAEHRNGFIAGITYDHYWGAHLSLGGELRYEQRGFMVYKLPDDQSAKMTGVVYPIEFQYEYVSLPIKASYTVGKKLFGFVSGGVVPGILLHATTVAPSLSNGVVTGEERLDATPYVQKFDFALSGEAGGGYKLRRRYWAYVAVSYQRSLSSSSTERFVRSEAVYHKGPVLSLGLKVALKV